MKDWREVFPNAQARTQTTQITEPCLPEGSVNSVDSVQGRESGITTSTVAPELPPVDADTVVRRWPGFVAQVVEHGGTGHELNAMFTDEDRADLCAPEHDDARLAACARTVAESIMGERHHPSVVRLVEHVARRKEGRQEPRGAAQRLGPVRCMDCRHFAPRAATAAYGTCAAAAPGKDAAALRFGTHRHSCGAFEATT